MELKLKKRTWLKSFLSIAVLAAFVIMATGSLELIFYQYFKTIMFLREGPVYDEGCDCWKYKDKYDGSSKTIYSNEKLSSEEYGKWNGPVVIMYESEDPKPHDFMEEVVMVDGKRDGKSKISYLHSDKVIYKCYKMGKRVDCEKSYKMEGESVSSYDVLVDRYPWFTYVMNFHGISNDSIQSFMDTLDIIINDSEFEAEEFEDYYSDAMDVLEETPYDSIIQVNSFLAFMEGFEEMKNSEFRMAIFDTYLNEGTTTFGNIKSKYPGYLSLFIDAGISENDLEIYCSDVDSCMDSYGELNLEDDHFIDSVDTYMYRAITDLMEQEETSSTRVLKLKYAQSKLSGEKLNFNTLNNIVFENFANAEDNESISTIVLYSILSLFLEGDYIQKAAKEAYLVNHEIPRVPTIATSITDTTESSGFVLQGYIVDDGGSEITTKGITWATYYNPTIEDNLLTLESNSFSGTLSGLEEGKEYFARAYSITARDTVYGNCVKFVAGNFVGVNWEYFSDVKMELYPNPASTSITIKYNAKSSSNLSVSIININGQEILHHDLNNSLEGEQVVQLNVSKLTSGFYYCLLKEKGQTVAKKKLSILE